jgi:hypothetical protein
MMGTLWIALRAPDSGWTPPSGDCARENPGELVEHGFPRQTICRPIISGADALASVAKIKGHEDTIFIRGVFSEWLALNESMAFIKFAGG